ncbi:hypothetical protein Ark11_0845 [Candidatus Ichthyocystis hellenicum]|uniref:Uncharacterized protein n=2 Tax=Candidatus Ichthyocystis hellenicum TaxID=1561003 RepID=A0A0S4M8F2_9BURK|nr:hypothetical protein Ark11_0845 [Candidatus Ichthyocystis hellenicum]
MDNVSNNVCRYYFDQDCKVTLSELVTTPKDDCKLVKINDESSFTLVLAKESLPINSVIGYSYNKFLQDLCSGYGYFVNINTISESYDDSFLQDHAIRYGYKFTEHFLSVMGEHKSNFLNKIDSILTDLCGSFYFLKELGNGSVNIIYLMNKICSSFSKCVYNLREKCVDVLQSEIIPITIKSIFDSIVIDGGCHRKMTYSEMEQLFLRFITTLENLIMSRIMKYWRDFCNQNKELLSLIPTADYSNPFYYAYHYDGINSPNITHPAAFAYKFGEYISFIAVARIDVMMSDFVEKCSDVLKIIIRSKCTHICNYSSDSYSDIRELVKELQFLIKAEFDKRIIEDSIKDHFNDFLSGLIIWRDQVVDYKVAEVILESIISDMRKSLVYFLHNYLYDMIRNFHPYIMVSGKIVSSSSDYLRSIENKMGIKIHPEDSYNIISLRRKFSSKYEKVVWNKFVEMLREKHEFSDGTVISKVAWSKISRKLFPIAQGAIRPLLDMERLELSRILSRLRIVDDICTFDFSSSGTREATFGEKNIILKLATRITDLKTKCLFRKIWINLTKITEDNKAKEKLNHVFDSTVKDKDSLIFDSSVVQGKLPVAVTSPIELNCYSSDVSTRKIINKWGLNLHPDDHKVILFVRRKFSVDTRYNIYRLFSSMLEKKSILPSGKVICRCSWSVVSGDLCSVAMSSLEPIIKDECEELERFLSEARVVDVDENNSSSFVVRKTTEEEKIHLMKRAKIFIDKELKCSARLAWLDIVKISKIVEGGGSDNTGSIGEESMDRAHHNSTESSSSQALLTKVDSFVSNPISSAVGVPYLHHQLLQDLCKGYGYNVNFKEISKDCDDNFLMAHAVKCGYRFSDNFFSTMIKHKIDFLNKVDSILTNLCSSFYFLRDLGSKNVNVILLMDKICYSFSQHVYSLRDKCIDVLQSEVIPATIIIIFDSVVTVGSCERKMSYSEMEQLFLLFITKLEKLIMVRIIKYWHDFCSENKELLSLVSFIDYSDPFFASYRYSRISLPHITHPAAFTCKFDEYISFMAVTKIDMMVRDFVERYSDVLKKNIRSRCMSICSYSPNPFSDIKKILINLSRFIRKEFDKMLTEKAVEDNFSSFFNELIIWKYQIYEADVIERCRSSIVKLVTNDMYKSLMSFLYTSLYDMVKGFCSRITSSWNHVSKGGNYLRTIENRLKFKIYPEDGYNILYIRKSFSAKSRKIIWDKFFYMISGKHKFSDGTVISRVSWNKISKKLFPVAQGLVKHFLDMERLELSKLISKVRIVEDIGGFDISSLGTREATSKEKASILRLAISSADRQTKDLFRKVWVDLVKITENYKSKAYTDSTSESTVKDVDMLDVTMPVELDCCSLGLSADKIISKWKLNLHPDDDKIILFIRRKFSTEIKSSFRSLFSGMLSTKTLLSNGEVLRSCSWPLISGELYPIALEFIDPIIENEYKELDAFLSKARVVDFDKNDSCSCVVRKVTAVEKNNLMRRAKKFVYRELRYSARLVWLDVVKNSKCGDHHYTSEDINEESVGNACDTCGVNISCVDNAAILRIRKKFSSKIVPVICAKFSEMLKNRYKFDDGTVIDKIAWFRISKKMFPIVEEEIKCIVADEYKELDGVVSRSRVVINCKLDREITNEEKVTVLSNIMKLVHSSLKALCGKVWEDVVTSLWDRYDNIGSTVDIFPATEYRGSGGSGGSGELFSLDSLLGSAESDSTIGSLAGFNLRREDDNAILNIRKRFSSNMRNCVRNKFCEMLKTKYEFDDHTVIDMSPWVKISKKLLPIAKKEIMPIMKEEYVKINEVLLKSSVVISSHDCSSIDVRDLTSKERSNIIKMVMKLVYRQSIDAFGRVWRSVIRSSKIKGSVDDSDAVANNVNESELEMTKSIDKPSPVGLSDLRDSDKSELDNIRLEFVGGLASVIDEVVRLLLLDLDLSSSGRGVILDKVISTMADRSNILFKEGGFFDRVESILLDAMVIESSEKMRLLDEKERKFIFRVFVDSIDSDRDYLAKKRTGELMSFHMFG